MSKWTQVYNRPAWRRVRLVVLERDGGLCQIRGPGCKVDADQVDHVVPVELGGAWYDERNLRAACGPCNRGRASAGDRVGTWRTNARYSTAPRPSREW
jgi:5-methylcytosine-specific restriction endonuclease McrA